MSRVLQFEDSSQWKACRSPEAWTVAPTATSPKSPSKQSRAAASRAGDVPAQGAMLAESAPQLSLAADIPVQGGLREEGKV